MCNFALFWLSQVLDIFTYFERSDLFRISDLFQNDPIFSKCPIFHKMIRSFFGYFFKRSDLLKSIFWFSKKIRSFEIDLLVFQKRSDLLKSIFWFLKKIVCIPGLILWFNIFSSYLARSLVSRQVHPYAVPYFVRLSV